MWVAELCLPALAWRVFMSTIVAELPLACMPCLWPADDAQHDGLHQHLPPRGRLLAGAELLPGGAAVW